MVAAERVARLSAWPERSARGRDCARGAAAPRPDARCSSCRRRCSCCCCSSIRSCTASSCRSSRSEGGSLANYASFFADRYLLAHDLDHAEARAAGDAHQRRRSRADRLPDAREVPWQRATTILVVPITLGTVLIAEGMLTYLGPKGWLNRSCCMITASLRRADPAHPQLLGRAVLARHLRVPVRVPADPVVRHRHRPGAGARGGDARRGLVAAVPAHHLPLLAPGLAITFCLTFVQAFSVFPSAVLVGAPAGPTRVISIAAYEAAFEQYDYSLASAIAMIMGVVQLIVVVARARCAAPLYRGPVDGRQGMTRRSAPRRSFGEQALARPRWSGA